MDILIVSRCLPWPLHHGDRLILHHLAAELTARGHSCDVVAFGSNEDVPAARTRLAPVFRDLDVVAEQPRTSIRYLSRLARPFPRRAEDAWNPAMWRAVERRLNSRLYDIVHVFGGVQVYELRELVRRLPAIIVPYESYSLFLDRSMADARRLLERLRIGARLAAARQYERVMYRGYDRVVMLTEADRLALLRLAPDLRVVVIPNGVRIGPARGPHTGPPEVLFVGNFAFGPNVRAATILAREVLPRLREHHPDVRVVLAGANPPPAVSALSGDGVEVTGWVPDIGPYLARASCFVAPITQGAGLKNKILEAMAAGLPVVTTPLGCEGIAAVDGEHVLLGPDSRALSMAVKRLLDDPGLSKRIGETARRFVAEHHAWAHIAARYEALYAETIAERSG